MTRLRHHAARFCRRLGCWFAAKAAKIDPPPVGDDMAAALRACEVFKHVEAGRIRKRRGESERAFCLRVARGDYVVIENLIDFNIERGKRMQRALKKGNVTKW